LTESVYQYFAASCALLNKSTILFCAIERRSDPLSIHRFLLGEAVLLNVESPLRDNSHCSLFDDYNKDNFFCYKFYSLLPIPIRDHPFLCIATSLTTFVAICAGVPIANAGFIGRKEVGAGGFLPQSNQSLIYSPRMR
jgi:hypothetical protein